MLRSARSRKLLLVLAAGTAVGVLAWSADRPQGHEVAAPPVHIGTAPPLRALDEPPPAPVADMLRLELGLAQPGIAVSTGIDTICAPAPCKAADLARAKTELAQRQDAIRPAAGTSPRTVAELPGVGLLLAWRNHASQLCLDAQRTSGGGTSVFGPCADDRARPCTAICLVSDGSGKDMSSLTYLLAGTVRADATALRITTAHARTVYPLRGPLLPGTSRRVFMLDLGRNDYRMLELLHDGAVIDSRALPAFRVALEDCEAATSGMSDLKSCLQSSPTVAPGALFP